MHQLQQLNLQALEGKAECLLLVKEFWQLV